MVSSAMSSSSSRSSSFPTCLSWSTIESWYGDCQTPACPSDSGLVCVRRCMWVVFIHTKNGVSACTWRRMKSTHASVVSSSMVSIRFLVNGPVSSMRCRPMGPYFGSSGSSETSSVAQEWMTPRGRCISASTGNCSFLG